MCDQTWRVPFAVGFACGFLLVLAVLVYYVVTASNRREAK